MLNAIHLRTLLVVLRTGTFSEAARELNYTASAVSQQIAALERATGLVLFERQAHATRPTSAAYLLRDRCEPLVANLEVLQDEIVGLSSGRRGTLRLGSFPTASARLVPKALSHFMARRPLARVVLDEAEPEALLPALMDGVLDIALVYEYGLVPRTWPDGIAVENIRVEDLILLLPAAHPKAGDCAVDFKDLAEDLWISSQEGTGGSISLHRICMSFGYAPRVHFRSNNYDVVRGLVRSGAGVAVVPALGYWPDMGVTAHLTGISGAVRYVRALYRKSSANPVIPDALEAVRTASEACADFTPVTTGVSFEAEQCPASRTGVLHIVGAMPPSRPGPYANVS